MNGITRNPFAPSLSKGEHENRNPFALSLSKGEHETVIRSP